MHGFTLHYRHERCALLQRRLNSVTGLPHKCSDAKSHPPSAAREGPLFVELRLLTTCQPVGASCCTYPTEQVKAKSPIRHPHVNGNTILILPFLSLSPRYRHAHPPLYEKHCLSQVPLFPAISSCIKTALAPGRKYGIHFYLLSQAKRVSRVAPLIQHPALPSTLVRPGVRWGCPVQPKSKQPICPNSSSATTHCDLLNIPPAPKRSRS